MMFSDAVSVVNALLSFPPGAFVPLLMFVLVFWVVGKIFRSLVLGGHWVILCLAAAGFYTFVAQLVREGQYVLVLMFGWPLILIGRRTYQILKDRA